MQTGKFNCVVDSAWGSSAKGAASTRLVDIYNVGHISANNYPNAGHTAIVNGEKFIAKVLPTASILSKIKSHKLGVWIGPNSGFDLKQFNLELQQTMYGAKDINIHERATIVEDRHVMMERPGGLQSTEYISSTMSGSGAAYTEKAMRRPDVKLARDVFNTLKPFEFINRVREKLNSGETFCHEVSQGFALSVNHGTHYPYCTFRDCTPQQAVADFGITPQLVGDIYLNVRSFPIRVGNNYRDGVQTGYSGDCMSDQIEMTWEQIGKEAEMPGHEVAVLAEKERTTVTKKIRRTFTMSWQLLLESAIFCGATKQILNFPQYLHWSAYKVRGGREQRSKLHHKVRAFIDKMEEVAQIPVVMVGTGPNHEDYIFLD
jgi:adenylosuccinate synthase